MNCQVTNKIFSCQRAGLAWQLFWSFDCQSHEAAVFSSCSFESANQNRSNQRHREADGVATYSPEAQSQLREVSPSKLFICI